MDVHVPRETKIYLLSRDQNQSNATIIINDIWKGSDMETVLWLVMAAVLLFGFGYAISGIKLKKSEDVTKIICANPNCGYKGEPIRKKYFSMIIFLGLCLLWLLPGIVYAIVVQPYKYWCPQCHTKLSV